ncbi:MAG: AAA family ATPase [Thermoanaerobaculia bacterium]
MLLPSLRIESYRVFDRIEIERLGRVNLFVGGNNTGKSSLLEAVRIFASSGSPSVLWDILVEREELIGEHPSPEQVSAAFEQVFRGREGSWETRPPITIGPIDNPMRIATTWLDSFTSQQVAAAAGIAVPKGVPLPVVTISFQGEMKQYPLEDIELWRRRERTDLPTWQQYVPASGLSAETVAKLWDAVALTAEEDDVTAALRFVSPDIERMSIVGRPRTTVMAKITSFAKPVPLRSLGDGVIRVLGIALALANASNGGVVVIDEIENGLHHTVQRQLWELIFAAAHRRNLQIFATTHSWDCIESFQRAASDDPHEEALLVRLETRNRRVHAVTVRERELSILAREQIEVR